MPDVPYRRAPDGVVRTTPAPVRERNVLRALVQHFPLFDTVAPGRSRGNRSLGAPGVLTLSDHLLEGHRVRDVVMLTSGNGTIALAKNRTEVIVRPGGRGEFVEVIRFCGLLSGENTPVALAVAGSGHIHGIAPEHRELLALGLVGHGSQKRIHSLLRSLAASPSAKLAGLTLPWLAC